jgi:hypothetical protein
MFQRKFGIRTWKGAKFCGYAGGAGRKIGKEDTWGEEEETIEFEHVGCGFAVEWEYAGVEDGNVGYGGWRRCCFAEGIRAE